ncbi:hypothetical protein BDZ97DRAFT_1914457 [Flammula alnicola]|nr:hypothetical protein BDZ97DRAFT_1914457 [Flammula alnicola]
MRTDAHCRPRLTLKFAVIAYLVAFPAVAQKNITVLNTDKSIAYSGEDTVNHLFCDFSKSLRGQVGCAHVPSKCASSAAIGQNPDAAAEFVFKGEFRRASQLSDLRDRTRPIYLAHVHGHPGRPGHRRRRRAALELLRLLSSFLSIQSRSECKPHDPALHQRSLPDSRYVSGSGGTGYAIWAGEFHISSILSITPNGTSSSTRSSAPTCTVDNSIVASAPSTSSSPSPSSNPLLLLTHM